MNNKFTYLRAIGCIAIVILHSAYVIVVGSKDFASTSQLMITNSINNMLMWAVPVFVMVTGSLLLDQNREISYKKLFSSYILRIVFLLILFSIVYKIFDVLMSGEELTLNSVFQGIENGLKGESWVHLWYFYMLLSLYLLLPFLKIFIKGAENKDIKYVLLVNLIFLSIIPMVNKLGINLGFYVQITTIYTFYLISGYAIYNKIINIRKGAAFLMLVVSLAINIIIVYLKWYQDGASWETYNNYYSLVTVVESMAIFSLFVNSDINLNGFSHKLLLSIDRHSLGIYLVHMIFLRGIFKYTSFNAFENTSVTVLLVIGVFFMSYLITFLLKRVPLIKKYI